MDACVSAHGDAKPTGKGRLNHGKGDMGREKGKCKKTGERE
jgi:hypothetical protein